MSNVKLEIIKRKTPKQWTRHIIRIVGTWTTVNGKNEHYEPVGRYDCWTGPQMKTAKEQQALKDGKTVDAIIKMIDNRPTVIRFEVREPEPFVGDIATQRAEYEELGGILKILIVEPETLSDYCNEDNWFEFNDLIHLMQVGGFLL